MTSYKFYYYEYVFALVSPCRPREVRATSRQKSVQNFVCQFGDDLSPASRTRLSGTRLANSRGAKCSATLRLCDDDARPNPSVSSSSLGTPPNEYLEALKGLE